MLIPTALWFEAYQITKQFGNHGIIYLALFNRYCNNLANHFSSARGSTIPVFGKLPGADMGRGYRAAVLGETLPGHFLIALSIILGGLFISQLNDTQNSP